MFVEEKAVGEKQPIQVGTLKLSEAIRTGAKLRGQCRAGFFREDRSCALGAAIEAKLGRYGAYPNGLVAAWLEETFSVDVGVLVAVMSRNDAGESRESIADWLESRGH